jgi:glycosyltransferase involved in cell wall biosynthesis
MKVATFGHNYRSNIESDPQLHIVASRRNSPDCPFISILINNYNYGRFVDSAIESALAQTWKFREIIVVDDGSTDNSRQVIQSYGRSIIPIFKENGGQGSAFNAGFAACRGELICFLDADDLFLPRKLESIAKAWRQNPHAGLIYHQLHYIDGEGKRRRGCLPSSVSRGQSAHKVQRSGGWWPLPTTSGLACSREYLEEIFPVPLAPYRLCADSYIGSLAPFITEVVGVREPLALYRLHGENRYTPTVHSSTTLKRHKHRYELEFNRLKESLEDLEVPGPKISLEHHYPYQLCCWKADGSVSRWQVFATALRTPSMPLSMKLKAAWNIVFASRKP